MRGLTMLLVAAGASAVAQAAEAAPAPETPDGKSPPPSQQEGATNPNPNSGCPEGSSEPLRRRPGQPLPERLAPPPCDPNRLPTPRTVDLPPPQLFNRWKVIEAAGVPDNYIHPYSGNNPIKGDRPLFGEEYINLTATSNTQVEDRQVPAVASPTGVGLAGRDQLFKTETLTVDAFAYQGDTVFRPPDWQVRFTPIFNYNTTETSGTGTTVTSTSFGAQNLFFEAHLRNVSANFDFDSVRIGIQAMISDFRGFVLSDQPVGVRFFGTRDSQIYQYSIGWFRTLPKNADKQNELGEGLSPNDIVMGNLEIEDTFVPGYNSELTVIYDRNRATGTQVVAPDAPDAMVPATFIDGARHDFDVGYVGYSGDGHFGRWNLTTSLYEALGEEQETEFGVRNSMVQASFAAAELSRDFDWIRVRGSAMYASGDPHPFGSESRGFDGISESALFAGADSSFFLHQQLKLISGQLDLKERDSLYPDLRSSTQSGVPNFKNPGIRLVGLGADLDLAPQLRVSLDTNHIWLDQPQTVEAVLGSAVPRDIGQEFAVDVIYRPLDSQNIILRLSGAELLSAPGAQQLTGGKMPFSTFADVILTF